MKKIIAFDSPAECFEQAFPVGNGFLGAMFYGKDRMSVNLDSLWSGTGVWKGKMNGAAFMPEIVGDVKSGNIEKAARELKEHIFGDDAEAYVPLGDIVYSGQKIDGEYRRELDLACGVVRAVYTEGGEKTTETCCCSYVDGVLMFTVKSSGRVLERSFGFSPKICGSTSCRDGKILFSGVCPDKCYPVEYRPGSDTIGCHCCLKEITDGKTACTDRIYVTQASSITVLFYGNTTYYDSEITVGKVERFTDAVDCDGLTERHVSDYKSLFDKTDLELNGDTVAAGAEILFNLGKYLLISCSRAGSMPANLQGIWNENKEPIWQCGYTLNINLEMNYWGCEQTGLGECKEPLVSFVKRLSESGAYTAREVFGSNGWCVAHNSDIWLHSTPVGASHGGDPSDHAFFFGGAGWLCLPLYEHYLYTSDREYLAGIVPVMRGAVEFYLDNLYETDSGYALIPSASAENTYIKDGKYMKLSTGTAIEQSVVEGLFKNYCEGCRVLGLKDDVCVSAEKMLPRLRKQMISSDGRVVEWDAEYGESDVHHRHISNLYCNYPECLVPKSNTALRAAVKKSLDVRGVCGTGWSIAWKTCQYARLGEGEKVYELIERALKPVLPSAELDYENGGGTYPNYLCAHPPFQIDGNFGMTAALCEAFVQSSFGIIELMPAVPSEFESGCVKGMRAVGGYSVSYSFSGGRVNSLTVSHQTKTHCRVFANDTETEIETNKEYVF